MYIECFRKRFTCQNRRDFCKSFIYLDGIHCRWLGNIVYTCLLAVMLIPNGQRTCIWATCRLMVLLIRKNKQWTLVPHIAWLIINHPSDDERISISTSIERILTNYFAHKCVKMTPAFRVHIKYNFLWK